jgi:hypothetical protein
MSIWRQDQPTVAQTFVGVGVAVCADVDNRFAAVGAVDPNAGIVRLEAQRFIIVARFLRHQNTGSGSLPGPAWLAVGFQAVAGDRAVQLGLQSSDAPELHSELVLDAFEQ